MFSLKITTRCLIGVLVFSEFGSTADVFLELLTTSSIRFSTGVSSSASLLPATEPVDVKAAATAISAADDSRADFSFIKFFLPLPLKTILSRAGRPIEKLDDMYV